MAHEQDCRIHSPQRFELNETISFGKPISDYSVQEIRAELTRRRNERRKIHANAKTNLKIRALEKELERLKKELI